MSEMTQTVTGATQPQSDDASRITARDLRSVFWRSFTLQGSWNYERQQHMGYAFAMSPALKRIYQDPTELGRALQRHLVLFNTTPHLSTFIFGLSIAMEEENQRNPEFNEGSINA
ncbi:PTS system mannose/fructose/sorbose family transporter subunit IID, partial [Klebsiella pneumoniae]